MTRISPLLALFVIRATGGYQFQAVSGAAPLLAMEGYSYSQIGLLIGAYMLPGFLITVPAGVVTRTIGDIPVIATGLVLMFVGSVPMAIGAGFESLLFGRLISGTGGLIVLMLAIKMTTDRYNGPLLSTATGVVVTSWYAGFAAALIVSAWLATWGNARLALVAAGLPPLLGLAALPFVGPPQTPNSGPGPNPPLPVPVPWRFTASAALCWTMMNVGFALTVGFLPAWLVALGWDPATAGARGSVLSWSAGAATILGGWMADRVLGRKGAVLIGASACALCTLLLPPSAAAMPLLIATGLTFALYPAALTAQVGAATPPTARGVVFGWYSGASYIGLTVSPWLAGILRDATGDPAAPIWLAAALLAAFLPAYAWFLAEVRNLSSSATARA